MFLISGISKASEIVTPSPSISNKIGSELFSQLLLTIEITLCPVSKLPFVIVIPPLLWSRINPLSVCSIENELAPAIEAN